jgi:hypothetical protein
MMPRMSKAPPAGPAGRKPRRILARIVAAAFSIAMLTAISGPASAATIRSAAPASPAVATTAAAYNSPVIPAGYRWVFVAYFSTLYKCREWAGQYELGNYSIWRCYLTQRYDLPIYELDEQIAVP